MSVFGSVLNQCDPIVPFLFFSKSEGSGLISGQSILTDQWISIQLMSREVNLRPLF